MAVTTSWNLIFTKPLNKTITSLLLLLHLLALSHSHGDSRWRVVPVLESIMLISPPPLNTAASLLMRPRLIPLPPLSIGLLCLLPCLVILLKPMPPSKLVCVASSFGSFQFYFFLVESFLEQFVCEVLYFVV
jgi:hypothetical protein